MHFQERPAELIRRMSSPIAGFSVAVMLSASTLWVPSSVWASQQNSAPSHHGSRLVNSGSGSLTKADGGTSHEPGINPQTPDCSDGFTLSAEVIEYRVILTWDCSNPEDMRGMKMERQPIGDAGVRASSSGHWDPDYTGPIVKRYVEGGKLQKFGITYSYVIKLLNADEAVIAVSSALVVHIPEAPEIVTTNNSPGGNSSRPPQRRPSDPEPSSPDPTATPTPTPTPTPLCPRQRRPPHQRPFRRQRPRQLPRRSRPAPQGHFPPRRPCPRHP